MLAARRAGVLLHPTSLPGPGPRGTLGADARRFVDWLAAGGFSVWQTLPLGVTDAYGSPYCLRSAYAGDPRFIDAADLADFAELPARLGCRRAIATARYASFAALADAEQQRAFAEFVRARRRWLLPYGLFELLSARFDAVAVVAVAGAVPRARLGGAARVSRGESRAVSRASCSSSICSSCNGPR